MNIIDCIDDRARTWAEIDLSALKHNLDYAKEKMGRKVICVLKANAYGHGAVECGRYLEKCGAYMFAVATIGEALELREAGIKLPVMILGYTSPEYAEIISKYDIEQTVVGAVHWQGCGCHGRERKPRSPCQCHE